MRVDRRLLTALLRARGDLDARVGKANNWQVFCYYLAGYVVNGLFGIITAIIFAIGNAWQAAFLSPALAQHQAHIAGQAQDMTIDSAFGGVPIRRARLASEELLGTFSHQTIWKS